MSLLRQYTMGDEPMALELLSDPFDGVRKGQTFPTVNCEDTDLNVCMPVFSIHGNHDDPQGMGEDGTLSALDVLAAAGLLNYFGRLSLPPSTRKRRAPDSPSEVIGVKPVLLQKGQTRIALYGMGYIKDERLSHELREKHICMYRPAEATDSWFNLLVLHQNRYVHSTHAARRTRPRRMYQKVPWTTRCTWSYGATSTSSVSCRKRWQRNRTRYRSLEAQ